MTTYLNSKALSLIAGALIDARDTYEKLENNPALPDRLQAQFSAALEAIQ